MIDVRQTLLGAGKMNKGRLEAFTDAILAIIMTIMVLELHTPNGYTWPAIQKEIVPLLAYVISFVGLTNLWATHHFMFEAMHTVSYGVFIVNMALLLWVSLVPVSTAWVATYPTRFLPQVTYIAVIFGWAVFLFLLGHEAHKADPRYPTNIMAGREMSVMMVIMVLGAICSFFLPDVALTTGVIVIGMYLVIPHQNFVRHRRRQLK